MDDTKIALGDEITDVTTGITGIAQAVTHHLDGTIMWMVQVLQDNNLQTYYISDSYVKRVGDGVRARQQPAGFYARTDSPK